MTKASPRGLSRPRRGIQNWLTLWACAHLGPRTSLRPMKCFLSAADVCPMIVAGTLMIWAGRMFASKWNGEAW